MKKLVLLLPILFLLSCSKTEPVPLAFYYWRTTFQLSSSEKEILKELEVKKLYIRYFDVALKENEPIPIASVVFNDKVEGVEVVPVIYIKNEVFLQNIQTQELARKIFDFIGQINRKNGIEIDEIQFDCDWSLASKQNYFQFIDEFKKLHSKLSTTIRLHQVKYPEKTGVPEVLNGVLMYYNMGVISAGYNNSIYERAIAERYIKSLKNYSLPLNIALPIFSWGVHIRNGVVVNLIGGMREKDVQNNHFEALAKHRFRVVDDFLYKGRYLAKNDIIKIEEPSESQLKEMVSDLKKNLKSNPKEIILYDLKESNLSEYENEIFKAVSHW